MSALHRLKAYFGMVPVDEFDAAHFADAAQFEAGLTTTGLTTTGFTTTGFTTTGFAAAGFDAADLGGESHYAAERPAARHPRRTGFDDYDDAFPTPAGHRVVPRVHPTRSPSSSMDTRQRSPRASAPWGADTAVRGSLAVESRADLCSDDDAYPDAHPLSCIVTLHPHSYNEARPIGERYREGNPVIMNLTAMEDRDAKRLVDFAAGLAFALRGSIDKVTNKVFLLSPPDVEVSAEDRRRIAEGRPFR
ncbi:MAG: cell division protein SepF [Pseudonocardiaceae bacterium]